MIIIDAYDKKYGNVSGYDKDNKNIPEEVVRELVDRIIIEKKDDRLFHIGVNKPIATVYCKRCGGKEFYVGRADYYTGVKCKKCEWELCIHEG